MSKIANSKCPHCAAPLKPSPEKKVVRCTYCGSEVMNPAYSGDASEEGNESILMELNLSELIAEAERKVEREAGREVEPETGNYSRSELLVIIGFVTGLLAVIITVFILTSRCSSSEPTVVRTIYPGSKARGGSAAPKSEATAVADPVIALENKLKIYSRQVDICQGYIAYSVESYIEALEHPKAAPTCTGFETRGLHSIPDWIDVIKTAHKKQQAIDPPMPELAQAVDAFISSFESMHALVMELNDYFTDRQYMLDDCAKAQRLHPDLMKGYAAMTGRYQTIHGILVAAGKGSLARCLERTAKDPQLIAARHWADFLQKGRAAMTLFRAENKKEKPDITRIKQEIAALNEAVNTIESLSDQQKEAVGYGSRAQQNNKDLIKAALDFMVMDAGRKSGEVMQFPEDDPLPGVFSDRTRHLGSFGSVHDSFNDAIREFFKNKVCGPVQKCSVRQCPEW